MRCERVVAEHGDRAGVLGRDAPDGMNQWIVSTVPRMRRCICPKPSATCLEGSQCHTVYRAWCHSPARCRSGACPPRGRACQPRMHVSHEPHMFVRPPKFRDVRSPSNEYSRERVFLYFLLSPGFFRVEEFATRREAAVDSPKQRRRATAH